MIKDIDLILKILDDEKDARGAGITVSNETYAALCPIFEHLEFNGTIYGNGHHIAQLFARAAELIIIRRHAKSTQEEKDQALKALDELRWG